MLIVGDQHIDDPLNVLNFMTAVITEYMLRNITEGGQTNVSG